MTLKNARRLILLLMNVGAPVHAQQLSAYPRCEALTVRGRVSAGESYEVPLSPALVFRLAAEEGADNPAGWTIRVTPVRSPDMDYSMVATPPYRFANPRYLDTGFGVSAEEALAMNPREFAFVGTAEDYESAADALDILLWPYSYTETQVAAASAILEALPTYPATFVIEDGSTSNATADDPLGRIESIAFRLEACVPP